MPQLDISVALTNPYTLDSFTVLRRQEAISITGRSIITNTLFTGLPGVVYSEGAQNLERREDGSIQNKTIVVITGAFPLRSQGLDAQSNAWQPDIVGWHGNNFLVDSVEDFSSYAFGFVKAICKLYDSMPVPENLKILPAGFSGGGGHVQSLGITILSPTTLQLNPVPNPANLLLFKNGQKLSSSDNDYTLALPSGIVTLTVALLVTDFVEAYA